MNLPAGRQVMCIECAALIMLSPFLERPRLNINLKRLPGNILRSQ